MERNFETVMIEQCAPVLAGLKPAGLFRYETSDCADLARRVRSWNEQLDEKVREYLPDMTMEREVPLSRHTSFRIGGPARRMAFPTSREQLVILLGLAEECGIRPFLLGRGLSHAALPLAGMCVLCPAGSTTGVLRSAPCVPKFCTMRLVPGKARAWPPWPA